MLTSTSSLSFLLLANTNNNGLLIGLAVRYSAARHSHQHADARTRKLTSCAAIHTDVVLVSVISCIEQY